MSAVRAASRVMGSKPFGAVIRPRSTPIRLMGGDGHHPHNVFEPPFKKSTIALIVWGGVAAGAGIIVFSWKFQNAKQGFTK